MEHRKPSKVTQKDRYGNQITYEYAPDMKPLDPTQIAISAMEKNMEVPEIAISDPVADHPGGPKGTDTVPAWLTPGEFVVNAEAMRIPGAKEQIEALNDEGRIMQQQQGGSIPGGYQMGGEIPFIAGPRMNLPQYQDDGGWVNDQLLDQLAKVESNNNNDAVSHAGAVGMYQWLPTSAAKAGYGVKAFDPKDPKAARAATAKYLRNMQKYHGFTPKETLQAYNWGPGNVINFKKGKRKDIPDEAKMYPGKIWDAIHGPSEMDGTPILPTPAPNRNVPLPEARPEARPEVSAKEELPEWKSFLNKYVLGEKTQFKMDGGAVHLTGGGQARNPFPPGTYAYEQFEKNRPGQVEYTPPPVDPIISPDAGSTSQTTGGYGIADGIFDLLTSGALGFNEGNVVPSLDNVSKGHKMFGGDENFSGKIAPPPPGSATEFGEGVHDDKWYRTPYQEEQLELDPFGGEGQDIPDEDWRKSYDETHPEHQPLIGKQLPATIEKAIQRQEKNIANSASDDPMIDIKFEHLNKLKQDKKLAEEKLVLKAAGKAEEDKRLDQEKIVALEDKKTMLESKAAEAEENGEVQKAEFYKNEASKINKKLETTPTTEENDTVKSKTVKVTADKIANQNAEKTGKEQTGPDQKQPGPNTSTEKVIEAGKGADKDPGVIGVLKEAFSDLFDSKELARMAIMYAGSRALGYSHGGSLQFAGKQYINRIDAKANNRQQFIKSNAKNYTAQSLQAYKKSGDLSDLVAVGTPTNVTGQFKNFYKDGKTFRAQQYKNGKNTYWSSDGGKTAINSSYHENASAVRGTKEYNTRIASESKSNVAVLKELQSRFDEIPGQDGEPSKFNTEISANLQGKKIAEWAARNNVDTARVGGLIEKAYHDAINDAKATGRKPRDITPYLNSLIIREETGTPALFVTNPEGVGKGQPATYVSGSKMRVINNNILTRFGFSDTNDVVSKKRRIDKLNNFWSAAQAKWNNLDPEVREQWTRKSSKDNGTTGFYEYVNNNL